MTIAHITTINCVSAENERVVFCVLRVRDDIVGLGISYDKIAAKEEAGTCGLR